jgi:aspartate/methionine/tyrosine aminotransferase
VLEAAQAFLRAGQVRYTPAAGLPELRAAIAGHYRRRHGIEIPPRRIVITPGASGGFLLVLALLVEPGAAVAVADPGYPCYPNFIRLYGGEPRTVPVTAATALQLCPELLEPLWGGGLRGLIVASPGNPTGAVMTEPSLRGLARQAQQHGGFLVSDEIYHGLEYGEPAATAAGISEEAFVVNSFSKYFGMTGWRLGWVVVPEAAVEAVERLAQNLFIAPPTPSQVAALASFDPDNLAELERRREILRERRDFLCEGLERLGFGIGQRPAGAFYVYAECGRLTADSAAFASRLLEATGVAVTPGLDFGIHAPEAHLRFAYTTPIPRLAEGLRRLGAFLDQQFSF